MLATPGLSWLWVLAGVCLVCAAHHLGRKGLYRRGDTAQALPLSESGGRFTAKD